MDAPKDIRDLAELRLAEADFLFTGKFYEGAFYLAGYAVELCLKAKICECLNLPDLYVKHVPKTELSKVFMVHNLDRLLLLSGLLTTFETVKLSEPKLMKAWSCLAVWNEKARYDKRNSHTDCDIKEFIDSVRLITEWINKH